MELRKIDIGWCRLVGSSRNQMILRLLKSLGRCEGLRSIGLEWIRLFDNLEASKELQLHGE